MGSEKGIGAVILVVILAVVAIGGAAAFILTQNNSTNDTATPAPVEERSQLEEEDDGASEDLGSSEEVVYDLTAQNFTFSQEEIRVNVGDTVTVNLTVEEGFHDFVIDEFDAATEQVNAGETTSVTFVANEAGEYEYYCSVGQHRELGMVGTLVVEE